MGRIHMIFVSAIHDSRRDGMVDGSFRSVMTNVTLQLSFWRILDSERPDVGNSYSPAIHTSAIYVCHNLDHFTCSLTYYRLFIGAICAFPSRVSHLASFHVTSSRPPLLHLCHGIYNTYPCFPLFSTRIHSHYPLHLSIFSLFTYVRYSLLSHLSLTGRRIRRRWCSTPTHGRKAAPLPIVLDIQKFHRSSCESSTPRASVTSSYIQTTPDGIYLTYRFLVLAYRPCCTASRPEPPTIRCSRVGPLSNNDVYNSIITDPLIVVQCPY